MFGLLNIDKPPHLTSRDVVNHVQRLIRPHKVGHAGTLDPMATGVLVICVGQATRLNQFVQQVTKTYLATFQLGRSSATEDTEGEIIELADPPRPTPAELQEVLHQFHGRIMQRPPAFSALKVKGERAYSRARRGERVRLEPRPVHIERLELVNYRYPELMLKITCGSGTYVRSLGRDIAEAVGSAAVMSSLRRTAVGPFLVDQALELDELSLQTLEKKMLPATLAVEHLPRIEVSSEETERLGHGQFIEGSLPADHQLAAAVDSAGDLVALVASVSPGKLKPHRFFPRRTAS